MWVLTMVILFTGTSATGPFGTTATITSKHSTSENCNTTKELHRQALSQGKVVLANCLPNQ